MQLQTSDAKPSAVLRLDRYFGTYDRAVAWLAVNGGEADSEMLIADLYGIEPGQVKHDVVMARKREAKRPRRSIRRAKHHGPAHPTGGTIR